MLDKVLDSVSKAGLLARESSFTQPSQLPGGVVRGSSSFTVAGAAADFHRFPKTLAADHILLPVNIHHITTLLPLFSKPVYYWLTIYYIICVVYEIILFS